MTLSTTCKDHKDRMSQGGELHDTSFSSSPVLHIKFNVNANWRSFERFRIHEIDILNSNLWQTNPYVAIGEKAFPEQEEAFAWWPLVYLYEIAFWRQFTSHSRHIRQSGLMILCFAPVLSTAFAGQTRLHTPQLLHKPSSITMPCLAFEEDAFSKVP